MPGICEILGFIPQPKQKKRGWDLEGKGKGKMEKTKNIKFKLVKNQSGVRRDPSN